MRNLNTPSFASVKMIVIMRGASGSGKSTLAQEIEEGFYSIIDKMNIDELYTENSFKVASADHYFTDEDGNYKFDGDKLTEAHEHCMNEFMEAINNGANLIIVDNTNMVSRWYNEYVKEGEFFDYKVVQLCTHTPEASKDTAIEYFERCVHSVPLHTIERQISFFEKDTYLDRVCFLDVMDFFKEKFTNIKIHERSFKTAMRYQTM